MIDLGIREYVGTITARRVPLVRLADGQLYRVERGTPIYDRGANRPTPRDTPAGAWAHAAGYID